VAKPRRSECPDQAAFGSSRAAVAVRATIRATAWPVSRPSLLPAGWGAAEPAVPVDAHEQRPRVPVVVGEFGQPRLGGAHRAGDRVRPVRQGGGAPVGVPVGLRGADLDLHAFGGEAQVDDVEGGEFAAPGAFNDVA
jgi:hypothetical protein